MADFHTRECPVSGPQEPVPYNHVGLSGAIPKKCNGCEFHFEGECKKITNRLLRLDYGPCGIVGSKELVRHPKVFRGIPKKCSTCKHLAEDTIRKLICTKDPDIWGEFQRGLDY